MLDGVKRLRDRYWVAALKPGVVIFELQVDSEELARKALKAGSRLLPFKAGPWDFLSFFR